MTKIAARTGKSHGITEDDNVGRDAGGKMSRICRRSVSGGTIEAMWIAVSAVSTSTASKLFGSWTTTLSGGIIRSPVVSGSKRYC